MHTMFMDDRTHNYCNKVKSEETMESKKQSLCFSVSLCQFQLLEWSTHSLWQCRLQLHTLGQWCTSLRRAETRWWTVRTTQQKSWIWSWREDSIWGNYKLMLELIDDELDWACPTASYTTHMYSIKTPRIVVSQIPPVHRSIALTGQCR